MTRTHRRPPRVLVASLVLVVLATAGYLWWRSRQPDTPVQQAFNGVVEAREYQVAASIPGSVTAVTVAEGAAVTKGQVLARLDQRALSLQVDQAAQGVTAARAALDSAREDGTSAEVAAARARLRQAEAAQELAEVQRGYATITAPHAGRVVTVATNPGQSTGPGRTLLTLIDPADLYVRVFVPQPRVGALRLGQQVGVWAELPDGTTGSSGAAGPIGTVAAGGTRLPGVVRYIASAAQFSPTTVETRDQRAKLVYEVRTAVTDRGGTLKPGMPVDVTFE